MFNEAIYEIDIATGSVYHLGTLPCALASHSSVLINDQYLIIYGGTNGLRFFDSVVRFDLTNKKCLMMTKYPKNVNKQNGSMDFFSHGRISTSMVTTENIGDNGLILVFGGNSIERDHNEILIIPIEHALNSSNFEEINIIMWLAYNDHIVYE